MPKRQSLSDKELQELKENVAACCRVLYSEGLMRNLGHVTARIPGTETFLLGFNRYTYGRTQAKDVLTYDLDGKKLSGPDVLLPIEIFLYTEVFKARKNMNGIVHVHMPASLAFGVSRREILPLYIHDSEVLRFGVPVIDHPLLISTIDRGESVARGLGDSYACHLRGHGQVIVGESAEFATGRTLQLEEQARINLMALQLTQNPRTLSQGEVEEFIYESTRTPWNSTIPPYSKIRAAGKKSVMLSNLSYLISELKAREKTI